MSKLEGVKINDGRSKNTIDHSKYYCRQLLFFGILIFSAYKAKQRDKQVSSMLQPFQQQLNEAKARLIKTCRYRGRHFIADFFTRTGLPIEEKSYEQQQLLNLTKTVQEYYNSISGKRLIRFRYFIISVG